MGKAKMNQKGKVKALMASAQELLAKDEIDQGIAKMREAMELAPENGQVANTFGCALADTGHPEEAVEILKKAVQLSPSSGFEKYMYLGQLLEDEQAVSSVRAGVKVLQHESLQDPDLRVPMAAALCSLAELLLTGHELKEIEVECENLVKEAMRADPSSAEPMQVMASLRNEQGLADDALKAITASVRMWLPPASDGEDPFNEGLEGDNIPSFEFRFEAAKLLLDVDSTTDTAIRILSGLLMENDTVIDVWYLLGLAHHGACQFADAMECIERGMLLVKKHGAEDPAMAEAKTSEFAELRSAVEDSAKTMGQDLMDDDDDGMDES